ncbi:hypothetical protein WKH56_19605 [Priestia sp. SB1]|uniref:hypothetical protein n=1 Tax=Priestia sp. SB1 TaxID=3132359 RepID=UPI003174E265
MSILTIDELREYLNKIIMYKVEFKFDKDEEFNEKIIEVYERDEDYPCDNKGNITGEKKTYSLTRPYVIYLSESGIILYIEHSFGLFTVANKDAIIHLISLIGTKIEFNEEENVQ